MGMDLTSLPPRPCTCDVYFPDRDIIQNRVLAGEAVTPAGRGECPAHWRASTDLWPSYLMLAERYGWQPAGAAPPRWCEEDNGLEEEAGVVARPWNVESMAQTYLLNDGQRITPADARALADALERALPDIPDHEAATRVPENILGWQGVARMPNTLLDTFSGSWKELVRTLIRFLRRAEGGVEIW